MPLAEISAALTSLRAAFDLTKAMVGLRDAETFRSKSIELQSVVLEALEKSIEAREAYATQADRIRTLEAEVTSLKNWDAEKENYELKHIRSGSMAYMLKPDKRGTKPPHWLCPTCFAKGQKSFLNATGKSAGRGWLYHCTGCDAHPAGHHAPSWQD
jgi:hypothetical protein